MKKDERFKMGMMSWHIQSGGADSDYSLWVWSFQKKKQFLALSIERIKFCFQTSKLFGKENTWSILNANITVHYRLRRVVKKREHFTARLTIIESWFFDTQNTFHLIVKGLENAFFMPFSWLSKPASWKWSSGGTVWWNRGF